MLILHSLRVHDRKAITNAYPGFDSCCIIRVLYMCAWPSISTILDPSHAIPRNCPAYGVIDELANWPECNRLIKKNHIHIHIQSQTQYVHESGSTFVGLSSSPVHTVRTALKRLHAIELGVGRTGCLPRLKSIQEISVMLASTSRAVGISIRRLLPSPLILGPTSL